MTEQSYLGWSHTIEQPEDGEGWAPQKVLIVDDVELNREFIAVELEGLCLLLQAANAYQAWQLVCNAAMGRFNCLNYPEYRQTKWPLDRGAFVGARRELVVGQ